MKTPLQTALDLAVRADSAAKDALGEAEDSLRKARETETAAAATYAALYESVKAEYVASTRQSPLEDALDELLVARDVLTRKRLAAFDCAAPSASAIAAARTAEDAFEILREKLVDTYGGAS